MAKLHIKGRMLQLLDELGPQWDYELFEKIAAEYPEVDGEYWYDTIRLELADLYSSGITTQVDEALDAAKSFGNEKVLFRFALTDFGRERMRHTGLLRENGREAA
ncbi:MAG: hypothetical protein KY396_04710 [Actinobacteria bacterium]|nr:hypothetical protein [Actinomycetota bacterium]